MKNQEILKNYKEYLITHKTSLTYYNYLRVLFNFLDKNTHDCNNLTNEIFTQFLSTRKKCATETFNLYIKALHHFYKYFLEKDNKFISDQLKTKRPDKKIPHIITEIELNRVINYIITEEVVKHLTPIKIKAIAYTLFYTGLRKGEFLKLKRSDFDLNSGRLIVRVPTKGKTERIVILIDKLVIILKEYFASENTDGTAFNVSAFQVANLIKKFNNYLPNKHLTPQKMRHSYGRNLYQKGVDLNTIKEQMGHSDISTTILYTNPDLDTQEKIIREKLEGK